MAKKRVLIFILTIVVVGTIATLVSFYARGYRLDPNELRVNPNGLLVVKSVPDGASIVINGELKTATDATIPLPPGTYDLIVRKEGYITWNKRIELDKEVVTQITVHLFKSVPSLSAVTFSGSINPQPSYDLTKIAFAVPPNLSNSETLKESPGLWVIEAVNLPIGFARDPRRITNGDLTDASYKWSPDSREILLTTGGGNFLLDAGEFTPQSQLVNISSSRMGEILADWKFDREKKLRSKVKRLPGDFIDIVERRTSSLIFSPDEDMILYTASSAATILPDLIKQLPGSSTQEQERNIKEGQTYVYDIKEDRNFLIYTEPVVLGGEEQNDLERRITWFSTSRHLILAEPEKITIMDYDGTNRHEVYTGSYVSPHAFPTLSTDRLLILTNLGASEALPNLYSLSLK